MYTVHCRDRQHPVSLPGDSSLFPATQLVNLPMVRLALLAAVRSALAPTTPTHLYVLLTLAFSTVRAVLAVKRQLVVGQLHIARAEGLEHLDRHRDALVQRYLVQMTRQLGGLQSRLGGVKPSAQDFHLSEEDFDPLGAVAEDLHSALFGGVFGVVVGAGFGLVLGVEVDVAEGMDASAGVGGGGVG